MPGEAGGPGAWGLWRRRSTQGDRRSSVRFDGRTCRIACRRRRLLCRARAVRSRRRWPGLHLARIIDPFPLCDLLTDVLLGALLDIDLQRLALPLRRALSGRFHNSLAGLPRGANLMAFGNALTRLGRDTVSAEITDLPWIALLDVGRDDPAVVYRLTVLTRDLDVLTRLRGGAHLFSF
jgi:hypothetical protein